MPKSTSDAPPPYSASTQQNNARPPQNNNNFNNQGHTNQVNVVNIKDPLKNI